MDGILTAALVEDPQDRDALGEEYCLCCFGNAVVVVRVIALGIESSMFPFDVVRAVQLRCSTMTAASEMLLLLLLLLLLLVVEEVVNVVAPFSLLVSYDATVAASQLTTIGNTLSSTTGSRHWFTSE